MRELAPRDRPWASSASFATSGSVGKVCQALQRPTATRKQVGSISNLLGYERFRAEDSVNSRHQVRSWLRIQLKADIGSPRLTALAFRWFRAFAPYTQLD